MTPRSKICRSTTLLVSLWLLAFSALAEPIKPSFEANSDSGNGPLLLLFSGADGFSGYVTEAKKFASEGFVVLLFDTPSIYKDSPSREHKDAVLRETIRSGLLSPATTSTKAAVIGYSLGGELVLDVLSRLSDLVASAVAYYPATFRISDTRDYLKNPPLSVPTLMLAGTFDSYRNCCLIEKARELKTVALTPDVNAPLELHEYPFVNHGFNIGNYQFDASATRDAFTRSLDHIRKHQQPRPESR